MAETLISLVELVGEEKLRALVEEVSHLSASPMLVLDACGEVLAKAGQRPIECLWGKEGSKIESDSSVVARCTARNCPFSGVRCVFRSAQGLLDARSIARSTSIVGLQRTMMTSPW